MSSAAQTCRNIAAFARSFVHHFSWLSIRRLGAPWTVEHALTRLPGGRPAAGIGWPVHKCAREADRSAGAVEPRLRPLPQARAHRAAAARTPGFEAHPRRPVPPEWFVDAWTDEGTLVRSRRVQS